jgi:preprotein translocase subunit YajC
MPEEQAVNPLIHVMPLLLIFFISYFLIFKPQKDKQLQHKKMMANLKKNDEVVTVGGIHGTIVNTKEHTVILRVDDNVKIEIDREAISTVTKTSEKV